MTEAQREIKFVSKQISALTLRLKSRKRYDIAARADTQIRLTEAIAERDALQAQI